MLQSNAKIVSFVLILWALSACSVLAGNENSNKEFMSVLNASAVAKKNGDPKNASALMDRLDKLDQLGQAADKPLVDLLDYYIGEGSKAMVYEFIVQRGSRMIPLLRHKKSESLQCFPEYKSLCLSEEETDSRNRRIDSLIDLIEHK